MGLLRDLATKIRNAQFFTIMADESGDVSNKEQLVICFRWVDDNLEVHEDFIGLHPVARTTADTIMKVIQDVMIRMQLRIENARGQ